jgi:hypothetical protein
MEQMTKAMARAVTEAFQKLLSEKHLYQRVEVKLDNLNAAASMVQREWEEASATNPRLEQSPKARIEAEKKKIQNLPWSPNGIVSDTEIIAGYQSLTGCSSELINFDLPTINTSCAICDGRPPFNPALKCSYFIEEEGQGDFYYLGYQCQQCKGQPIRFLIRREGLKLHLAGRYPIEVLPTPKVFPKGVSKYYSDALVAHHAGQTLAGLFLLRVFVEQFWRTVPAVQELVARHKKATGDEQGDAYQTTLSQDFKSHFPSLKDVYGKLSESIHTADANATLFEDSCAKIEEHFDARRLYKVK